MEGFRVVLCLFLLLWELASGDQHGSTEVLSPPPASAMGLQSHVSAGTGIDTLGLTTAASIIAGKVGFLVQEDTHKNSAFELQEQFAYPIPDSIQFSGLTVSSSGAVLAWSYERDEVFLINERGLAELLHRSFRGPVAAAFVAGDTVIEVVSFEPRQVTRLTVGSRVISEQVVGGPQLLEEGALSASGWFFSGRDHPNGDYVVYHVSAAGSAREVYSIPARAAEVTGTVEAFLSSSGHNAVVTLITPPFRTVVVTPSGQVVLHLEPPLDETTQPDLALGDTTRRWVSLRTLPLDAGYIQTLSDIRSDMRIICVFDPSGSARCRELQVPIGFVASVPEVGLLIAVRNVGAREIVGYRWHWGSPDRRH
jgi:hypothetical protein